MLGRSEARLVKDRLIRHLTFWDPGKHRLPGKRRWHNKSVDATASSPVVKPESTAPPHHQIRYAGKRMTFRSVIPFRKTPARCRRVEFGGGFSDPPAAVRVDRITTFRHGIASQAASPPPGWMQVFRITTRRCSIASRDALRLLIVGSEERLTGRGREQLRNLLPVDSTSRVESDDPTDHRFGIAASSGYPATSECITSRWMRRRAAP